ncbi:MAG: stage III sporulation protein AB [Clostridia bacterium]|nr:stage III sporulation protein AB [Clostridia bacterium]
MLIFKIVVSICIICISTYIGIIKSKKLVDREYILRDMVTFLGLVENEIKYMLSILPNAYESARQKLNSQLKDSLGQIVVDMLSADNYHMANQSIVNNIACIDGLSDYDKNVITSTLKNLGRSDVDGQLNIINNSINILDNQIKEANTIKLKNSKLYRTIGAICGIMLVVIFI